MKKTSAFTLIEILVVLGISVILGVGGFLSLANLRRHQALDLSANSMVAFLRDSQQKSISQDGGLGWGVHFENGPDRDSYWRFSGFDPLVASEKITLPSGVELSSVTGNVFFSKISGLPDSATVVKIRLLDDDSSSKTITINAQGSIEAK